MTAPWALILLVAVALWVATTLATCVAQWRLGRRLDRQQTWPTIDRLIPITDLAGTWLGTIGVIALAIGRQGYGIEWAGCLGLLAFMITVSLYDRAVLMPSLDAAFKRLGKSEQAKKWEADWRFLWRMSLVVRGVLLASAAGALLLALLLFLP